MSDALTALQAVQIGKEVTPGTPVACPIKLNKTMMEIMAAAEFQQYDHAGQKITGQSHRTHENSRLPIRGGLTYDEIGYVLASLWGPPTTLALGSGAYRHVFTKRVQSQDTPQIYTVQVGDDLRSRQAANVRVISLELEVDDAEVRMTGSALGRAFTDGITRTAGVNEVQTITISGTGTFRLVFDGHKTAVLNAATVDAAGIQAALRALPNVTATGVTVSGSGPFVCTFDGDPLDGINVPLIEREIVTLTPTITIAETTRGGLTELDCEPVLGGSFSLYLASTSAGLSAGKVVGVGNFSINFGEVATARRTVDRAASKTLKKIVDKRHEMTVSMVTEANAEGMGILASVRSDADQFIRLESISDTEISSGVNYEFILDMAANFSGVQEFTDDDAIYAIGYDLVAVFSAVWGAAARVTLVNKVSAY